MPAFRMVGNSKPITRECTSPNYFSGSFFFSILYTGSRPLSMEDFFLEASERNPEIRLREGFISIMGHSIPSDPRKIYKPVLQWIKSYVKNPPPYTMVSMHLEFSDCDSMNAIIDILKTLAICQNTNHEIEIIFNWIYLKEDEAIKELGEFLESKLNVTFNYCEEISQLAINSEKNNSR